jgi:hypothetical protein
LRLQQGDFEHGWPDYELRWVLPRAASPPAERPIWDGSCLDGKTILVHAEQGLGDTIQFIRFLPMLKERGGTVLFACPPRLERLLGACAGIDQVAFSGAPPHLFDVQAPLMSLPGICGTTLATIPAAVPYLRADACLVEHWRRQLEPAGDFKIGIAWQGNPKHAGDRYRSIPLRHFEALANLNGVKLVSLQKGPGVEQLSAPFSLVEFGDRLDSAGAFLDTAALLMNLDLVVTVDSAVAHLAGALAVPVWVVLGVGPDWRWMLERADSPWYPTMRLFRQRRLGAWAEVLECIAAEVESVRRGRGPGSSRAAHGGDEPRRTRSAAE